MLNDFWFNVQYGMNHVLDPNGYDHVLFLLVLSVPFLFDDWKRVLFLVTTFTLGHTASLMLAAYGVLTVDDDLVEFLIPVTIMIVALYNVFAPNKAGKTRLGLVFISTLFFGLIHGLGFAREFRLFIGKTESKLVPLLEFALGIELAQIIIVFMVLFLGFLGQTVFRFSKKDWIMVVSAVVVGMVIPMLINSPFLS